MHLPSKNLFLPGAQALGALTSEEKKQDRTNQKVIIASGKEDEPTLVSRGSFPVPGVLGCLGRDPRHQQQGCLGIHQPHFEPTGIGLDWNDEC